MNLYGTRSAARLLGISIRQLTRYATELGYSTTRMGSYQKRVYSEANLDEIRKQMRPRKKKAR